jgi:hypothetical protein
MITTDQKQDAGNERVGAERATRSGNSNSERRKETEQSEKVRKDIEGEEGHLADVGFVPPVITGLICAISLSTSHMSADVLRSHQSFPELAKSCVFGQVKQG